MLATVRIHTLLAVEIMQPVNLRTSAFQRHLERFDGQVALERTRNEFR